MILFLSIFVCVLIARPQQSRPQQRTLILAPLPESEIAQADSVIVSVLVYYSKGHEKRPFEIIFKYMKFCENCHVIFYPKLWDNG